MQNCSNIARQRSISSRPRGLKTLAWLGTQMQCHTLRTTLEIDETAADFRRRFDDAPTTGSIDAARCNSRQAHRFRHGRARRHYAARRQRSSHRSLAQFHSAWSGLGQNLRNPADVLTITSPLRTSKKPGFSEKPGFWTRMIARHQDSEEKSVLATRACSASALLAA